jgi:uncharacterized membrane protein YfcA
MDWVPEALTDIEGLVLVATSFFTSFLTAAAGIGGGVALLAVMAQLMPAMALIPVHGIVQLGSNVGRAALMWRDVNWTILLYFTGGSLVGALIGGQIVVTLPVSILQAVLAIFILVVVWAQLPFGFGRTGQAIGVGGTVSTLLTMFVGATGPFVAASLKALGFDKLTHVATFSASMVVQHLLKVLVFGFLGFSFAPYVPLTALMIASGFLGTIVGRQVLMNVSEQRFSLVLNIILTGLAVRLLWVAAAPLF